MADKKISQLDTLATVADDDYLVVVDISDTTQAVTGTTKKAVKTELKGDKGDTGDAATVDVGTTTTGIAGSDASVVNSGTTSAAIFDFTIPRGDKGETGSQGIQGIQGIQGATGATGAAGSDGADGANAYVYIAYASDDTGTGFTTTFSSLLDYIAIKSTTTEIVTPQASDFVGLWKNYKGATGAAGLDGACVESVSFVGDDMVFVLDDASTVTLTGAKTTLTGPAGADGTDGTSYIWKGTYDGGTSYSANDCVTYNGTSYIYINVTSGSGHTPADDTYWDILALKGTDGVGSGDISGSGVANELAYFTAEKTIDNLAVATYPSLAELAYVKGVTSAIQTQLNGKQATGSYEVTTNKETSALDTSTTKYPCNNVVKAAVDAKMSNPMTAAGDVIYGGTSGTPTRLAKGTDGQVLTLASGNPSWSSISGQKVTATDPTTSGYLNYTRQFCANVASSLPTNFVTDQTNFSSHIFEDMALLQDLSNARYYAFRMIKRVTRSYSTGNNFNDTDRIIVKYYATINQTNRPFFIGFGELSGINPSTGGKGSTTYRRIGFFHYESDNKWYATTCSGTAVTETEVTGVTDPENTHEYIIDWDRTNASVKFYVDGTLKATNTTNLPTSTVVCYFGVGLQQGQIEVSPFNFSVKMI